MSEINLKKIDISPKIITGNLRLIPILKNNNGIRKGIIENFDDLKNFIESLQSYLYILSNGLTHGSVPYPFFTIYEDMYRVENKDGFPEPVQMPDSVMKFFKEIYNKIGKDLYERGFNFYYEKDDKGKNYYKYITNRNSDICNKGIADVMTFPSTGKSVLLHMHTHPFGSCPDNSTINYQGDVGIPSGSPPIYYKRLQERLTQYGNQLSSVIKEIGRKEQNHEDVSEETIRYNRLNRITLCLNSKLYRIKGRRDLGGTLSQKDKVYAIMGTQFLTFYGNGTTFAVYDLKNSKPKNYIQYRAYTINGIPVVSKMNDYIYNVQENYIYDDGRERDLETVLWDEQECISE